MTQPFPQSKKSLGKSGFTLIELAVMIALGAVLLVGMGLSTQNQIKAAQENREYLVALNLAKREMALVNLGDYPAGAAEAALTADPAFPNFVPTKEVVSVDTSGANSLREIRIRVRKGSSGGAVLVALYTYRSDILTFGDGI